MTHHTVHPIGAFALPAGLLLVDGEDAEVAAVRASLVSGRLPVSWPEALHAHELAHAGRLEEAAAEFAARAATGDPVAAYNHYVLAPEGVDAAAVRAGLPADLAPLVDVLRYSIGELDDPPARTSAAPEVVAMVDSVRATAALAGGDPDSAVAILAAAAEDVAEVSPPLSALLLGNAGAIRHEHGGDPAAALAHLRTACLGLADTDLTVARAELHLQSGLLIHALAAAGARPVKDAVNEYYTALQLVDRVDAPHVWATAHLNLGTAYLTMPMVEATDQLRSGIAMQSLRAALAVFTREEHPAEWASATLNLANALVYAPSTKQGDNLVEAVERYEEVLETRDRQSDPIGRARILANLGNALAHLGVFDHAKSRLHEARYLFEEGLDHDSVMMVRSILDEISRETVPGSGRDGHALPARPSAAEAPA